MTTTTETGIAGTYVRARESNGAIVYDVQAAVYGRPHRCYGTLISRDVAVKLARALADRYGVPYVESILSV